MTVPAQTPVNTHTGNGSTTTFAYSFKILAALDLAVYVNGVFQSSGYSVTGAGQTNGGTVVFGAAPANGATVVLKRAMSITRGTDYQQAGDFLAATVNADFDRQVLLLQQQQSEIARTLKIADGSPVTDLAFPLPQPGKAIGWNATGTGFTNYDNAGAASGAAEAAAAAAGASATAASGSATAASGSASAASASATAASGSASAAAASAASISALAAFIPKAAVRFVGNASDGPFSPLYAVGITEVRRVNSSLYRITLSASVAKPILSVYVGEAGKMASCTTTGPATVFDFQILTNAGSPTTLDGQLHITWMNGA